MHVLASRLTPVLDLTAYCATVNNRHTMTEPNTLINPIIDT